MSDTSIELQTWLAAPQVAKKTADALERARVASAGEAGIAHGRRRYTIRKDDAGRWSIFDPTREPAPFVLRRKAVPRPRANQWTKAQILRDIETRDRQAHTAKVQAKRTDRGRALDEQRATCRADAAAARAGASGDARRVAVAKARAGCAAALAHVEELYAGELVKLAGDAPYVRPRASRGGGGRKRERLQQRDDSVASELLRRGRADLIALWNRMKGAASLRGLAADRAIERFVEMVEEDEQQMQQLQAERAAVDDEALACEQAEALAPHDPEARAWAAENCDGGRPKRRSSKPSAHARTMTMLGLPMPPSPKKARPRTVIPF